MKAEDPVRELVQAFRFLPQVGNKTALKFVNAIVHGRKKEAEMLAGAILEVIKRVKECSRCGYFAIGDLCDICNDKTRNQSLICIVESVEDLIAIEASDVFHGLYHVLGGLLNPIRGVGFKKLRFHSIKERIYKKQIEEVIIALPPTIEGELTGRFIRGLLKTERVKITAMAIGVPFGAEISFLDVRTLKRAIEDRQPLANS